MGLAFSLLITTRRRFDFSRFALLFSLILICATVPAQARSELQLLIVLSNDAPNYRTVANEIEQRLKTSQIIQSPVQVVTSETLKQQDQGPHTQLAIAVGMKATRALFSQRPEFPVLSVLVPRLSYEAALKKSPFSANAPVHSALFLDQPIARQLKLAQQLISGDFHAGVLMTNQSKHLKAEINSAAQHANVKITIALADNKQDVVATITDALKTIDVLLAVFDPAIIDRQTAKQILYLSYRRRFPVIAYSKALVTAGALASVYTTPSQAGRHAADFIKNAFSNGQVALTAPEYPRYFSVSCNKKVARYLDLNDACQQPLATQLGAEK